MPEHLAYVKSPIGTVMIAGDENGIMWLWIDDRKIPKGHRTHKTLADAKKQVEEYFDGKRKNFDLKLNPSPAGTPFQKRVWDAVYKIPYGQTKSYGQVAKSIRKPKAVRAVGGANRHNRIPLIIPCHRVIGSDGKLTGYGGKTAMEDGVWRKEWLLKFEGAIELGLPPRLVRYPQG